MKNNYKKIALTLAVMAILLTGTVFGALVGYLSNQVTINADVKSPLQILFWEGSELSDNLNLGTIYGGDTISLIMNERNDGSTDITSELNIIISEPGVINDCAEITSLRFKGTDSSTWHSLICTEENNNLVYKVASMIPAGQNKNYDIELTFAPNVVGNYTATLQHLI